MVKEIKGYCIQKGKPNPNKPIDIETKVIGKNLFETYEVNGRQYTDNLGHNAFISIPKEQYIEYEQLKEENKQLKVELQEANDNIIWWSNRFKAVERDNKQLKEEIKKYINSSDFVYDELYKKRERIEKILGDKE